MSDAEIAAIRHNQFDALNERVNRATRDGDIHALAEYDTEIRALISAYNKLPDYNGVVHRVLRFYDPVELKKFLADYEPQGIRADPGFASSDKDASTGNIRYGTKVELVIQSRHGKDISWTSGQQDEVVFPPGHKFYIDSNKIVDGTHVIYLTDLGRDPHGDHTGRSGADSEGGSRAHDERRVPGPRIPSEGGTQYGHLEGEASEGPTRGNRGTDQELATLARLGTEADRSGPRRDDGVAPEHAQSPTPGPPHRPGFDPAVHKYVARFDDGRLIPSDPFYAGEYNPHIGRYQPTHDEISAALAHPVGESPHDTQLRTWHDTQRPEQARPHEYAQEPVHTPDRSTQSSTAPTHSPAPERNSGTEPRPQVRSTSARDSAPRETHPEHFANTNRAQRHDQSTPQHQLPQHTPPRPSTERGPQPAPRREHPHNPTPPREHTPAPGPRRAHQDSADARHDPRHGQPRPADPRRPAYSPEIQRALETRQVREFYRDQTPEGGHATPVSTGRGPNAHPAFDFQRHPNAPGGPVAVVSMRVHVTVDSHIPPHEVQRLWENAQLAADVAFNRGQRLLSGDRVLIDLVHTPDPDAAHLRVHVSDRPGGPEVWHPNSHPDSLAAHLRDQIGLRPDVDNRIGLSENDIRQISNDIAKSNTPAALDGLPATREIGRQRLQNIEKDVYQHVVEDALRDGNRFLVGADPRTNPYGRLINDGGPEHLGRNNNCVEDALAALSSFNGRPEVGAPRWPDRLSDGTVDDRSGEITGLDRAEAWIGGTWQAFNDRPIANQFQGLHDWIEHLGPGSSALVINSWHATDSNGVFLYNSDGSPKLDGAHATAIVYPHGASGPVWWDPQQRTFSDVPPPALTHGSAALSFMTVDPHGGPQGARTAPNQGTNRTVPGSHLSESAVPDDHAVRTRMGVPTDAHAGADRPRPGSGAGELRSEQADRSGDRALESSPEPDRGDVRRGDPYGTTGSRAPGVSTEVAGEHPTHARELPDDRVSRAGAVDDATTGTDRGIPADDRQEHLRLPAIGPDGDERRLVDGMAQPTGRDLADGRNLRGLDPDHTEIQRHVDSPSTVTAPDLIPTGTEGFDVPRDHIEPPDPPSDRSASDESHQLGTPEHRDLSQSGGRSEAVPDGQRGNLAPEGTNPSNRDPDRPHVERNMDPNASQRFDEVNKQWNPPPGYHPETPHVERSTDPNASQRFDEVNKQWNPPPGYRPETPHVERDSQSLNQEGSQARDPLEREQPGPRDNLDRRGSDDRSQVPAKELIDKVRDRVVGDPEKFALSYSDRELNALVEKGRQLGLSDRSITDLLQTGSRIAKPVTADILARHMDNWANVVSERGYPYRFDSAEHFNAFARDFHEALDRAGLGDLDPFIQGSALRKPEAKDVDFAIVIDRDRFYELLADRFDGRAAIRSADSTPAVPLNLKDLTRSEVWDLAQHIDANRDAYNSQARTFSNAVLKGVVRSTSDISKPLKAAGKEIQAKYPELNIEDISLIVPDSAFDSSPELPVVETTDKDRAQELADRLNGARELESQREIDNLYRIQGESTNDKPVPAVPERDDLPPPRGMHRGDDGLLHEPGDRPNSYRTRADGRLHDITDPERTFRDGDYRLRDEHGYLPDHLTGTDIAAENLDGIQHARTLTSDLVAQRGQELARDLADQRERVLENLNPNQREIVELAVELADHRLPDIEATIEHVKAKEALDRAWSALERGAPLSEMSRDLVLARDHLTTGQHLELESRLDVLRGLELGESAKIAEHVLEISIYEHDHSLTAQLEVADRHLVEAATRNALEFRNEHLKDRGRFVEHNLNRARELAGILAEGKVPELAEVLQNFDAIERVIRHEQEMEARAVQKLGLDPEHERLVAQALEAGRADALGKPRDVFRNELVRQATDKALEAREPEERATVQFIEKIREQAKELEQAIAQGKEPDPAQVRETYNQILRAVEHERALDSLALEPLGLHPEQTGMVTQVLEAERNQRYSNVLDVFGRELVRQDHNETVGQAKALELSGDRMRALDPKVYQLVRNHDPIGRDAEKGVFLYQQPGREPIEVPYDSLARRYAEAAKGIERGTPSDAIVQRFLGELGQGKDADEAVRERPEEAPQVKRAREIEARERGLERER
ncbi:toxin glutamine deamidase domain-containing protein [Nocardia sp. NBC_01499]|uniref:toxin glutamine deamidase domain-containing protein n=1 Tax=Nocardia sp. NBC_01499 TaxID=2903597 RepID=UPI0038700B4C